MSSFEEIYTRILTGTNCRTQAQLGKALGIGQSSVAEAKKRKKVPPQWYLTLNKVFGLNTEWLELGKSPIYLDPSKAPPGAPVVRWNAVLSSSSGLTDLVQESGIPYGSEEKNLFRSLSMAVLNPVCGYVPGSIPHFEFLETISMPSSFTGKSIRVFRMDYSELAPYVLSGAYVGVNSDPDQLQPENGIYAMLQPGRGLVLYQVKEGENALILSNNFAELEYTTEFFRKTVFGKVVWTLQNV